MSQEKKLCRNPYDKKIAGVCSGVADYLNIDANIVRVVWALFTLLYGAGVLLYVVCAFILPEKTSRH